MSNSPPYNKRPNEKQEVRARGILILVSGDEEPEIFDVPAHPMVQCQLIKDILFDDNRVREDEITSESCPEILKGRRIIELPNVRAPILARVIEFCRYHEMQPFHEVKKPFGSDDKFEDLVTPFDYDFIDQNHDVIFELLMAANYLDLKSLMDLCFAKIGWMMKVKAPGELCATFGFENSFSPLEAYAWAVENSYLQNNGNVSTFIKMLEETGKRDEKKDKDNKNPARRSVTKYHEVKLPEERIREEANRQAHAKFLKAKRIQEEHMKYS